MCNTTYSIHTCVQNIICTTSHTFGISKPPKNDQAYFRKPKNLFSSHKRKAELTSPCFFIILWIPTWVYPKWGNYRDYHLKQSKQIHGTSPVIWLIT